MKGTTTRARTASGRYPAPPTVGANALKFDYAEAYEDTFTDTFDDTEVRPAELAPPARVRRRPRPDREVGTTPVAPPLPFALPRAPFLILMVAIVVLGVVGVLVLNTKINENAFKLNDLRAQQAALDLQEQQLTQRLDELSSPGNLRAAARRLGLVPAGTPAFINLPDGRIVGVPRPATGSASPSSANPGR
jgi:hypothetical protein